MKRKLLLLSVLFIMPLMSIMAQQASLKISNSSDYNLTVKIMKYSGGLYSTLYIPAKQSRTTYFNRTGWFYTKTKAVKSMSQTLYMKDDKAFEIVCDERGYSDNSMTYYVSEYGGSAGESISKSEFEKDN